MSKKFVCLSLMAGCAIGFAGLFQPRSGSAVDEATAAKLVGGGCVDWRRSICLGDAEVDECDLSDTFIEDDDGTFYGKGTNTHDCGTGCGSMATGVAGCSAN